ncbi:MAG: hypothetical protein ACN4EP_07995, partial [Sediminibacterium sp.]
IIAKAIKAINLKVQRLQNETLILQGEQQVAEQELGRRKLSEITNWQQQLQGLYAGYFTELKMVKSAISGGAVARRILSLQKEVVMEYRRLGKEGAIKKEYDELLDLSMEILRTLQMTLSDGLSMRDAERLQLQYTLKNAMFHCLESVQLLNKRQQELILRKTRMKAEIDYVKRLHGIQ